MRLKTFTTLERLVLIPIELVGAMKAGLIVIPILFLLAYLGRAEEGRTIALNHGLFSVWAILMGILAGAVLTPLLLPWLPGRAFSIKGIIPGFFAAAILLTSRWSHWITGPARLEIIAWFFLIPALSAYLAMNFTGSSTYTSLSGVRKEMRWALPFQIGAGIIGVVSWIGSQFIL
jgi:acetyl-CoA decarbonylase/synthase complex subunit gamma